MKKAILILLTLSLLLLCGCSKPFTGLNLKLPGAVTEPDPGDGDADEVRIVLTGDGAEIRGGGARAEGSVVTISAVGTYRVTGTLHSGQLVVDTGEDAVEVTLILDGAEIRNPDGPALWIKQAKSVRLRSTRDGGSLLVSGTEADLASYDETRSGAAIYAEDDLIIVSADLTIKGYLNNGITCKDDFKMDGGTVTIESANNGLRASESVRITGGTLAIRSGNDGIKTSSDKKEGKGFIELTGGDVSIECGGDGVSAVTELRLTGGSLSVNARQERLTEQSCKGLKAGELVEVSGGITKIKAEDDGIRCDGNFLMSGGSMTIMAVTGIQTGVADSGTGDVRLTGGSLFIGASKQAVKAEGTFHANNDLMALCGSDKQSPPDEGGTPWIFGPVEGDEDDMILIGTDDPIIAPMHFKYLLYCSGNLTPGESYTVRSGERRYTMTAN